MNKIDLEGSAAWHPDSLWSADDALDPRSRDESD